jgi:hypothetical protein
MPTRTKQTEVEIFPTRTYYFDSHYVHILLSSMIIKCLSELPGVVCYFEPRQNWPGYKITLIMNVPYDILTIGSNFSHIVLNPIMVNWTPSSFPKERVHYITGIWFEPLMLVCEEFRRQQNMDIMGVKIICPCGENFNFCLWVQNNIQHQAIQISILLSHHKIYVSVCVWVFNVTFNNISVISWQSVLLVEKTNDLLQVTDKLYIMFYRLHLDWTAQPIKPTHDQICTQMFIVIGQVLY